MNVLVGLKLTSDANMVTDALSLRDARNVCRLHVFTDRRYMTELDNVTYHYLPKIIAGIPLLRLLYRIPILIMLCKKHDIKVLIVYHLLSFGFVGLIVSRLLHIPVSCHFLGKDIDIQCRSRYFGPLFLKAASRMHHLTAQGNRAKQFLATKGLTRVSVIPVCCDPSDVSAIHEHRDYDIIFVGRLSEEKRCDRFVNIAKTLLQEKPDLRAVILGAGPNMTCLLEQARRLGVETSVEFVGWVDDVLSYLSRSTAFLLTSDRDQLPLSLLQAMTVGAVPVASNVGNISDVVDDSNGYLIERNDIDAYATAVLDLLNRRDVRCRKSQACIRAVSKFSTEANGERWATVIERVAEAHPKRLSVG